MQVFMTVFLKMLSMAVIMVFGFILRKKNLVGEEAGKIIGQIATYFVFPCMAFSALYSNVSDLDKLLSGLSYVLWGVLVFGIAILCAYLIAPLLTKDEYERSLFRYSLVFSNYGFFGIAVMLAILGQDAYYPFVMFVMPATFLLFAWGMPQLIPKEAVNPDETTASRVKKALKGLLNPSTVAMVLGILAGLLHIPVPEFLQSSLDSASALLSPFGMLLAGFSIATLSFKDAFSDVKIWLLSLIRLIVMPLVFYGVCMILKPEAALYSVIICYAAMPLGMNTVVVPAAYGKDTALGAKMALISTLLCLVTIPLIVTFLL